MKNATTQGSIVVACAADDFYAMPLAATVVSVLDNLSTDRNVILFILDGGIQKKNVRKIEDSLSGKKAKIHWVTPSSQDLETIILKCKNSYPIANYYRLLLPQIIPRQYEKVIYLDTDVIALEDLSKLWSIDIGDNYCLAAAEPNYYTLHAPHLQHLELNRMGLKNEHKYFNAGVLVLNLKKWREEGTAEKIIEFIGNHPRLTFPDQDAMNVMFVEKWRELNPKWNQVHSYYSFSNSDQDREYDQQFSDVANNPYIVHFTSRPKPWSRGCDHPKKELFFEYLDKTVWIGWRNNFWSYGVMLLQRIIRRLKLSIKKYRVNSSLESV